MSKILREWEDKAELALMGKFVPVEKKEEVQFITSYCLGALHRDDLENMDIYSEYLHKYSENNKVTNIGTSTVQDMPCITYCIDTQKEGEPKPFEEDYGTGNPASFCFVLNTAHEHFSEFGDCFFRLCEDGYYHRVS